MYAYSPWSGHYELNSPLWTSAHWTQFTAPGWRFLSVPSGSSGHLPGGGAYVTLVPPDSLADVTIVVETLAGKCLRCAGQTATAQNVTFVLGGGLPGAGTRLARWRTTAGAYFERLADVVLDAAASFTVDVAPDSMETYSTVMTATHGAFPGSPIPPDAPFPLPYADGFAAAAYAYDALPRYFSDQAGSFAVRNGAAHQVVPADPGANGPCWGRRGRGTGAARRRDAGSLAACLPRRVLLVSLTPLRRLTSTVFTTAPPLPHPQRGLRPTTPSRSSAVR